jgi:hypothetical protein
MRKIDKIADGLAILRTYPDSDTYAEHDEFMVQAQVSEADAEKLKALGWREDKGNGWRIYT